MKTIKLLILLFVFNTNSIIAQDFTLDAKTVQALNKTGLCFEKVGSNFIYLNYNSKEIEKIMLQVKLEILRSKMGTFIDDELPEGDKIFKFIEGNTSSIWECKTEGVLANIKGTLYSYKSNNSCEKIDGNLIPGGDMFIPGGDMFIPGGDTFIPGGDTFSNEEGSYYFLKITFKGEQEIAPAILPLRIK